MQEQTLSVHSFARATGGLVADTVSSGVRARKMHIDGEEIAVISVPMDMETRSAGLTRAEIDVLERVLAGRSNRDIAVARGTSIRTVANQVASIFRKLNITSRAELVAYLTGRF